MIKIVLDESMQDHEFCDRWVDQMGELEAAVSGFTLDLVAERTQLHPDDIVAAVRMFADGRRGTAGNGNRPRTWPRIQASPST